VEGEATLERLRGAHDPGLYTLHVIPGYRDIDCWVGAHALKDVFPVVLEELDKHNA